MKKTREAGTKSTNTPNTPTWTKKPFVTLGSKYKILSFQHANSNGGSTSALCKSVQTLKLPIILPHEVQPVLYLYHMVESVVKAKALCRNTAVFCKTKISCNMNTKHLEYTILWCS